MSSIDDGGRNAGVMQEAVCKFLPSWTSTQKLLESGTNII